jgi:hypothetical protein
MTDKWAPERIYLRRGMGDEGSHTWSAESTGDEVEEVEYVRADDTTALVDSIAKTLMSDEKVAAFKAVLAHEMAKLR